MSEQKVTDRQLIDACNLLCEYVSENIATGYEIVLKMYRDESSVELIDPSGNEQWSDAADYGVSTIRDMCELSHEDAKK